MKIKLKVLNQKEKNLQHIKSDERWNIEKEFEIHEHIILELISEFIDTLDNEQFYVIDSLNRLRRRSLSYNEIENIVRPTKAWKKIHILISNQGFQTSRFTRISLFETIINDELIKSLIQEKLKVIEDIKNVPKIPEEKSQDKILPDKKNKVSTENLLNFLQKSST